MTTDTTQQADSDAAQTGSSPLLRTPEGTSDPVEDRPATARAKRSFSSHATPLFSEDAQAFHDRWTSTQAAFVDDPKQTVQQADSLVADTIQRLAQFFTDERIEMERQWSSGQGVSTEDLRITFQRYRSFFHRLLSMEFEGREVH